MSYCNKIWFTADWHIHHENIIRYCGRPFSNARHMMNVILKNYNRLVSEDDTIYFLGDLTMQGAAYKNAIEQLVSKMKGQKHLILGNHDKLSPFDYVDIGFVSVHTALEICPNGHDFVLVHDPALSAVDRTRNFLCGHVHELFKRQKNVLNVGVDVWNFKPVSLGEVIYEFRRI